MHKFKIFRSSLPVMDNTKPCDKAYKKYDEWFIDFISLDDLMKFVRKYRSIVLKDNYLEIYDDFRE